MISSDLCHKLAEVFVYFASNLVINPLTNHMMATKVLSNEFMQKIMNEEAWKELSNTFNWSETLLEKYQDKVDWNEISGNRGICWTVPMLQKFKHRINWDVFSDTIGEEALPENILETFKDKWNWHKLSSNVEVSLSYDLLDKFADLWDWEEVIDRYCNNFYEGHAIEFYERYKDHIPAAKVQNSRLWYEIVSQQKRQLIAEITA